MAIGCYIDRLTYLSSHLSARRQGYHRIHDNHNNNHPNHPNHPHHTRSNHSNNNHNNNHNNRSHNHRPSVLIELRTNDTNYQQDSSCNGVV